MPPMEVFWVLIRRVYDHGRTRWRDATDILEEDSSLRVVKQFGRRLTVR